MTWGGDGAGDFSARRVTPQFSPEESGSHSSGRAGQHTIVHQGHARQQDGMMSTLEERTAAVETLEAQLSSVQAQLMKKTRAFQKIRMST